MVSHLSFPDLDNLHLRHPGLTQNVCACYAEAASVCLSRHHISPVNFDIFHSALQITREVGWNKPSPRAKLAWNNADDATRDGAYAMCLAAVETALGLVALYRAETRTGADYYVGTLGGDMENSYRIEISGLDHGDFSQLKSRLKDKVSETIRGNSSLPAIAAVVGFLIKAINIKIVGS